jgi:hypothetical protein
MKIEESKIDRELPIITNRTPFVETDQESESDLPKKEKKHVNADMLITNTYKHKKHLGDTFQRLNSDFFKSYNVWKRLKNAGQNR